MVNITKFLKENSDFGYANFNRKFIFTQYQILGVQIPTLRKFAKQLEPEYIDLQKSNLTHEEILLYGFAASEIESEAEQLEYLSNLLPYFDNWCTCDSVVCAMKKLNGDKSYKFFTKLLNDPREFYVRVGIVGLMRYFIKTEKLLDLLQNVRKVSNDAYYVKMAIAWLYAEVCATNFEAGKAEIETCKNEFIKNKSISKANESYRVTQEQKKLLLKLKK